MPSFPALTHVTSIISGVALLLYTTIIAIAALVALLARTAPRRRAARRVLTILLRGNHGSE
ncbi:hypothetical protein [Dactylosporangium sp. CA-092794]|uniref:hypothetical protein n=1 Tax=Dactylosporangium sp. CA-092794 TaxID=3239929 RepID=UPI003D92D250